MTGIVVRILAGGMAICVLSAVVVRAEELRAAPFEAPTKD